MYSDSTTSANEVWQILANRAEDGTESFTDRCIGDQQDENRDAFASLNAARCQQNAQRRAACSRSRRWRFPSCQVCVPHDRAAAQFVTSCIGIRRWRRMKPGKFWQIAPKMGSDHW